MNADWVTVKEEDVGITDHTYSEAITILMKAWSVHQKTEANPTLLKRNNYAPGMWGSPFYHYQYQRNYPIKHKHHANKLKTLRHNTVTQVLTTLMHLVVR